MVGTITPASSGCMCSRSSCSPMKYQGAFAGSVVTSGLATVSSGACLTSENRKISRVTPSSKSTSSSSTIGKAKTVSSGPLPTIGLSPGISSTREYVLLVFFGKTSSETGGRSGMVLSCFGLGARCIVGGQTAIFTHPPEMQRDQDDCDQRQDGDMERVEADQCILSDIT